MELYLIRHGSTAGNLEHRYVGTTDEPLTGETLHKLEECRDFYPQPELVFASPLQRCVQTAKVLYPDTEVRLLPGLAECGFGEFEYKNYEELKEDARYQAWIDSGGTLGFPGGESREDFMERCCAAFLEGCAEAQKAAAKSAAFVVHGGTIMAILDRFSMPHGDYFAWQVKNAEGFSCDLEWGIANRGQPDDGGEGESADTGLVEAVVKKNTVSTGSTDEKVGKISADLCGLVNIHPLPLSPGFTGIEDQFVMKKNKKLRCGYTTGSCAAAAAKAAAQMLLSGQICYRVDLLTPKGIRLHLPVEEQEMAEGFASCAVRKYAGDDPDATDGIQVYARAEFLLEDVLWSEPAGREAAEDEAAVEKLTNPESFVTAEKLSDTIRKKGGADRERESQPRIWIEGGVGVGRVTKPGLEQPVGGAAINRVPREMIAREVEAVCEAFEYQGALKITISVPEGVEIAKRTFNPHLGIEGGISILGTSGIVVPMSEEALIASIRVEMKQKVANGERYILITPGNYGADFIRRGGTSIGSPIPDGQNVEVQKHTVKCEVERNRMEQEGADTQNTIEQRETERGKTFSKEIAREEFFRLSAEDSMKCSNYVGETLDIAEELGVKGILFVAHIGKFIKVSGGVMNTHSAHADCRAELFAAQAMRAGTPPEIVRRLLDANTTEEAVGILSETGSLAQTMAEVADHVKFHLQKHCGGAFETEAILFSNQYGYLGETDGAETMMEKMMTEKMELVRKLEEGRRIDNQAEL
ncbi:MAG: cobalt-precorrin-5B (C(1))-methyltransferase CbiD [Lachnospiraceae bacterium]|nr:cobalt-precorrin-5B (C(1))-methyltransferase CbiD [Lachnospiraceae bacterium]